MNKKLLALLIAALMLLLPACGGGSSTSTDTELAPIRIGLVAPMSGGSGVMGVSQYNGYSLAASEINEQGGVNGALIEIETYDDTGDPQKAASGAQKFADDDTIVAIGGSCNSTSTLAMVSIFDDAGLPDLVVSSSSAKLTGCSEYFFRMAVQDNMVGPQMGNALIKLGKKQIVIFYPNDDYGVGLEQSLREYLEASGATVLESLTYKATDEDFTAQITTAKSHNPEAIAMCGTPADSGLLIKQLRQNGYDGTLIGGTGLYNASTLELAESAAEGMYVIGVYVASNPDPKVQEFVTKYKDKYGSEPDGFAALAYDQMYVIAQAAEKAMVDGKVTREALKDALKETNYAGVTGTVIFNEVNDWVRDYLTLVVENGAFVVAQ